MEGKPTLLIVNNEDEFDRECKELKQVYAVVVTDGEPKKVAEILEAIQPLIKEFEGLKSNTTSLCTNRARHHGGW